jgi:hypothetical protein
LANVTATQQWLAQADSVLRRELAFLTLTQDRSRREPTDLRECDEEGSDNPPNFLVIARARPLGSDSIASGTTDAANVSFKYADFRIEVTSVARLVPADSLAWEHVSDSLRENSDPYEITISARVDTLQLTVLDYSTSQQRWAVCDPYGHVDGVESPYWGLITGLGAGIRIVRWSPPEASWASVQRLADSVQRASP